MIEGWSQPKEWLERDRCSFQEPDFRDPHGEIDDAERRCGRKKFLNLPPHKHKENRDVTHNPGSTDILLALTECAELFQRDRSQGQMQIEWPEPVELADALLPVSPFDLDLLPDKLRPWIADVSDRMQCPADFVAVSTMSVLGSLIGRKLVIRPKLNDDWEEHANLWAVLIGRSGMLKSPAMHEALRPLRKLSADAEENYHRALAKHKAVAAAAAVRAEEKKRHARQLLKEDPRRDVAYLFESDDGDQEPTLRRYVVNDSTVESLGVLHQQNPNGLLVYRDELVSLLDSLDDDRNIGARGFYLTAWNGDSDYTVDRIGRGFNHRINGICLSLLGSAQPGAHCWISWPLDTWRPSR